MFSINFTNHNQLIMFWILMFYRKTGPNSNHDRNVPPSPNDGPDNFRRSNDFYARNLEIPTYAQYDNFLS